MEFQSAIKEALAAREGLRKLGFSADDIYVRPQSMRKGLVMVHIFLDIKGEEFNILIDAFDGCPKEFEDQWRAAAEWWNNKATDRELMEIWDNSRMARCGAEPILVQLRKRGIVVPALSEAN